MCQSNHFYPRTMATLSHFRSKVQKVPKLDETWNNIDLWLLVHIHSHLMVFILLEYACSLGRCICFVLHAQTMIDLFHGCCILKQIEENRIINKTVDSSNVKINIVVSAWVLVRPTSGLCIDKQKEFLTITRVQLKTWAVFFTKTFMLHDDLLLHTLLCQRYCLEHVSHHITSLHNKITMHLWSSFLLFFLVWFCAQLESQAGLVKPNKRKSWGRYGNHLVFTRVVQY